MDRIDFTMMIIEILDNACSQLSAEDFDELLDNIKIQIDDYE